MMWMWMLTAACTQSKTEATQDSAPVEDTALSNDQIDPDVTWHADISPLLQDNCTGCHAEQGIAFGLESFSVASAFGAEMLDAVSSGRMPPWPADEDTCLPLQGTRTLSEDSISLLERWVELGTPEGSPDDAPASDTDTAPPMEADLALVMPDPYTPKADQPDDYRCFLLDTGIDEETFVTGMQVSPGNASIVHHVILYTDPDQNAQALDDADEGPGYECFGGPGFDNTGVIGGWAPGQDAVRLPEGVGLRLSPGVPVVAQVHYHSANDPGGTDQTTIVLDTEEDVATEGYLLPLANQGIDIPAGVSNHVESRTFTFNYGLNVRLWGGTPHMHLLGSSIRISVEPPDSDEETCLISIPEWDFDYQNFYLFDEPYTLENGSTIHMECIYDNSADNPSQPNDPPMDVGWGDGTADEMCLVFALMSL